MPTINRTIYTAEPEFMRDGHWQPCAPCDAGRWCVYRTHWFLKKRNERRPQPKRKRLAIFFGPDAELCARKLVAHSMSLQERKPSKRPVRYRSLTTDEWLRAQAREQE